MSAIRTEAWVLYPGNGRDQGRPAELKREEICLPEMSAEEVLAEPIYGCWEANMSHALARKPVDICRQRGEPWIVLGNAGVVRILRTGSAVTHLKEGDLCLFFCNGVWDRHGYTVLVFGYDAPGTVGLLAKRIKAHHRNVIPIPQNSPASPALQQWAAFSLRYITAWANWKVAYQCWQAQMGEIPAEQTVVVGWGGGVSLAELALARYFGCQTMMMASSDERLQLIQAMGITPIDRRPFTGLDYQPQRYQTDPAYRRVYKEAEATFLETMKQHTDGEGVSIFIDNIGTPIFRATLKSLARQGVITTTGWKRGMDTSVVRAIECINRHIHVFTHYARYAEGLEAVSFASETGWLPPLNGRIWDWQEIPELARDYSQGCLNSYFPLYRVNPL